MTEKLESAGASVSFARPAPNYLLLICGSFVFVCLLIGLATAYAAGNMLLSAIFTAAAASLAIFAWLNIREVKKNAAADKAKKVDWQIMLPDDQRKKLNQEVRELAAILDIGDEQLSDLLSAYIVAQDLALRQIQQEAKHPLLRHVSFGAAAFDGILVKNDLITCVEVSFLVAPEINQTKINLMLRHVTAVRDNFARLNIGSRVRLLVVLVTQLDQAAEAQLRSSLAGKFRSTPVNVDIRLLDFEALQKIYAENN